MELTVNYNEKSKESKKLTSVVVIFIIKVILILVDVFYGLYINSLLLITNGIYLSLDLSSIFLYIYSQLFYNQTVEKNSRFLSFRNEILSKFLNSVVIFFSTLYILVESIETFMNHKQNINTSFLVLISFSNLITMVIVIITLDKYRKSHSGDNSESHLFEYLFDDFKKDDTELIQTIGKKIEHSTNRQRTCSDYKFSEYISKFSPSLLLFIASLLINNRKIPLVDKIVSILISLWILNKVYPKLIDKSNILTRKSTILNENKKNSIEKEILQLPYSEYKLCINNCEIWVLSEDYFIIDIKIQLEFKPVSPSEYNNLLTTRVLQKGESPIIDINYFPTLCSLQSEVWEKIRKIMKFHDIPEFYIEFM